jgi:hypothetical protein
MRWGNVPERAMGGDGDEMRSSRHGGSARGSGDRLAIVLAAVVASAFAGCSDDPGGSSSFGSSATVGTTMTTSATNAGSGSETDTAEGTSASETTEAVDGPNETSSADPSADASTDASADSSSSSTDPSTTMTTTTMTTDDSNASMSTDDGGDVCDEFCNGCTCPSNQCTMCCALQDQVDVCQGGSCFCFG